MTDGAAGMQQFAGDATLLYYMSEEAQEGRDAFRDKRSPEELCPVPQAPVTGRGGQDLLGSLRAFAIPMRTPFRGVTVRTGARSSEARRWVGRVLPVPRVRPQGMRPLAGVRDRGGHGHGRRPEPVRDAVPVNVTVPAVDPAKARDLVRAAGCRTAKVKVAQPGQRDADDIARVEAVRDALGPAGRIRVDANGAWDVAHATRMLAALAPFGLEYAEQPCATLAEMAELRRGVDILLAADESVRRADDPLRVRAARAPRTSWSLKGRPAGPGVRAALEIARRLRAARGGVEHAVETSVGLAHAGCGAQPAALPPGCPMTADWPR